MPYLYEFDEDNIVLDAGRTDEVVLGFDYLAETELTASNVFTPQNVGIIEFTACLAAVIHAGEQMDQFKKALFRKRTREESGLEPLPATDVDLAKVFDQQGEPGARATYYEGLFHGIVGMITETTEMAEILLHFLDRDKLPDITNTREEIGDNLWYLSRLVKWADTTFLTEMRRNIDKLRLRHGTTGFDKDRDITRNLEEEHALLEGDSDQARMRDGQEHDAVMTAAGHPPEGDGQEHGEIMRAIRGED